MMDRIRTITFWAGAFFISWFSLNELAWAEKSTNTNNPFQVGVCTHFSQGKGVVSMNLRSIQRAGIGSIRDEAGWSSIEREKGKRVMPERYDDYVRQASRAGLDVLLILDYANHFYDDGDRPKSTEAIEGFCRYAEFVVRHFGKDVRLYEIWNEWDIGIGLRPPYNVGGAPEDYVKLLKAVTPRIKAIDPEITVMGGGSTSGGVRKGWLEKILQLGALDYCDAISIHSYNYGNTFPERSPEACSAWMTGVQKMIRKYNDGRDVPFYVTEMGWPTHVGKRGTPPGLSASYLARLYLLARTSPSFRGLWWYDFQDDGWKPDHNENNFGVVRPDLTPKPAYHVLADIADLIANGQYIDQLETDNDHIEIVRFRHQGRDVWAVWASDDQEYQVILQTKSPSEDLIIHQLGHKSYSTGWGFRDWVSRKRQFFPDRLSVMAGPCPTLISGHMTHISVLQIIPRTRIPANDKEKK